MEHSISAPDTSVHLTAAYEGEIDKVVSEMLERSRDNYAQIEELALECSAALTSAKAKANGLSEQSLFKRLWNAVTGKNERLRTSIEEDRAAAQYAMQQAINSVLKECTQNRLLALAVKSKLENEFIGQRSEEVAEGAEASEEAESLEEQETLFAAEAADVSEPDDAQTSRELLAALDGTP